MVAPHPALCTSAPSSALCFDHSCDEYSQVSKWFDGISQNTNPTAPVPVLRGKQIYMGSRAKAQVGLGEPKLARLITAATFRDEMLGNICHFTPWENPEIKLMTPGPGFPWRLSALHLEPHSPQPSGATKEQVRLRLKK